MTLLIKPEREKSSIRVVVIYEFIIEDFGDCAKLGKWDIKRTPKFLYGKRAIGAEGIPMVSINPSALSTKKSGDL